MKRQILTLVLAGFLGGMMSRWAIAEQTIVFKNGRILTVDAAFSEVSTLAIRGERVIAVGESEVAEVIRGRDEVKVVDLGGRMVLPGLMDSHSHPVGAATFEHDHPVPDITNIEQLLAYIRSRAEALPEGTLIAVSQVFITRLHEQRYPTRAELDAAAPRHPVRFSTGPDSMLNSLAMRLAGIDRNYRLQEGHPGLVEKDANGEPTGLLRSVSVNLPAAKTSKPLTADDTVAALKALFRDYNSVGLTTIADRGASASNITHYQKLKESGDLSVRLRLSHTFGVGGQWITTERAIDEILQHPLCKGDAWLKIVGTKVWLDGGMLTGSALMQDPWGVSAIYGITDPEYRGTLKIPREDLVRMVRKVAAGGLQFTAHSVGDGAVAMLLGVYEELGKELPIAETRPCLTHSNFMALESIAKAAALGVVADIQPVWFYLDGRTLLRQFGNARMSRFQPLHRLVEAGVKFGGGSDHMQKIGSMRSINPYNPWLGMSTAVARLTRGMDEPLHPEEALSRAEAIRMYTSWNAHVLKMEKETGSLERGKLADLIVIDRDILSCPADEIRETRVLSTWVGGREVWRSPGE
jgi:predicted amidohydrolase YtcJ